ncbi:P-loop containing nucleoside triphosphate hydrolase [Phytophthora cactorum]|nr:P-loop containing nucleoside triphosphate hydrolase [Phytophthora cactorum]
MSAQVNLSKIPNLSQSSITVKQFPMVLAFTCTTEMLQGKTCKMVSSCHVLRGQEKPHQTLYVALSRSKTLANLTLTEWVTLGYIAKFKPDPRAAVEVARLISIIRKPSYMPGDQRACFRLWLSTQQLGPSYILTLIQNIHYFDVLHS